MASGNATGGVLAFRMAESHSRIDARSRRQRTFPHSPALGSVRGLGRDALKRRMNDGRGIEMKKRPILFRGEMVEAILAGKKTQTRSPVRWRSKRAEEVDDGESEGNLLFETPGGGWWPFYVYDGMEVPLSCPYGAPGERLWVKETFRPWWDENELYCCIQYRADNGLMKPKISDINIGERFQEECEATRRPQVDGNKIPWKPSIFMPRWACRITLEITGVRVEQLSEISEKDCWREGFRPVSGAHGNVVGLNPNGRQRFQTYYENINGPGSWEKNPWVWVIDFKRIAVNGR